jgi:sugar/nucleoside kinase (ribokinase family)
VVDYPCGVIVAVGHPMLRAESLGGGLEGTAALAAATAAAMGRDVQLVGKIGDDPEGDVLVLALAAAHVGTAALLRDAARRTPILMADEAAEDAYAVAPVIEPRDRDRWPMLDSADVDMGLRYLTGYTVVVVAEPLAPVIVEIAADAAAYAGAHLVVVVEPGQVGPADGTVIEAPASDADGAFATFLGTLAANLDAGRSQAGSIAEAAAGLGWGRPEA